MILTKNYAFYILTNNDNKKYKKETLESSEYYFSESFINISDYLDGTKEQLDDYCNIDEYINLNRKTYLPPTLLKDRLYITDNTPINPEDLNLLYDALYERYSL